MTTTPRYPDSVKLGPTTMARRFTERAMGPRAEQDMASAAILRRLSCGALGMAMDAGCGFAGVASGLRGSTSSWWAPRSRARIFSICLSASQPRVSDGLLGPGSGLTGLVSPNFQCSTVPTVPQRAAAGLRVGGFGTPTRARKKRGGLIKWAHLTPCVVVLVVFGFLSYDLRTWDLGQL